ncbi:Aluminum-induced protein [Zostera marina]|uniref:Aluminum-induced protein n=1 Tax=Zostera marina TaxID=29655 RepID=A0A0K9NX43_ZOSMR|nr:Aluminum-induced protein [Zostera marina]
MLAVIDRSVARSPEGLTTNDSGGMDGESILKHFISTKTGPVNISLGVPGDLAYSTENKNPLLPKLFGVVNGIFCLFQGSLENIPQLKQQYGLGKTADEAFIVIEAYKTLRDRGPYPADQVIRGLGGKFAFVLFDTSCKAIFVALDADGSVPFYWGTGSENHLVFCNDVEVVKKGCGKSFAPFPKGFFFTNSKGLQSFEHPTKEVKAVPRVDSEGQICGSTYTVDVDTKKKSPNIPRVGSEANWSSQY